MIDRLGQVVVEGMLLGTLRAPSIGGGVWELAVLGVWELAALGALLALENLAHKLVLLLL